tara:strand:+ start:14967 stop:15710 length:744 start_codon:yes stop_codon:yes gene_type:complete
LAIAILASPAQAETEETVSTRKGVTISFVVTEPKGPIKSAAILFTGGSGKVKLWKGRGARTNNFLVRSRALFANHGVFTITVDVPSDRRRKGLVYWRDTAEYRRDIAAVVKWVRSRTKAPLWLVGTSRGTVGVAYLAGTLKIDGAVFTATVTEVTRAEKPTAHDADLRKIVVPSLIVHHKEDGCRATPAESLPAFAAALKNALKVETILFDGGGPDISGPCKARSAHGFLGIEEQVVEKITNWMHTN